MAGPWMARAPSAGIGGRRSYGTRPGPQHRARGSSVPARGVQDHRIFARYVAACLGRSDINTRCACCMRIAGLGRRFEASSLIFGDIRSPSGWPWTWTIAARQALSPPLTSHSDRFPPNPPKSMRTGEAFKGSLGEAASTSPPTAIGTRTGTTPRPSARSRSPKAPRSTPQSP